MTEIEILSNNLIEVLIEPSPIVEVEVSSSPIIEIEVFPGGVSYGGVLSLEYQLVLGRLVDQPSLHKSLTYTDGDLTTIAVYTDDTLDTQLLDIEFTYSNGNLVEKKLTDVVSSKILTISYGYTAGNLTSTTEVFS